MIRRKKKTGPKSLALVPTNGTPKVLRISGPASVSSGPISNETTPNPLDVVPPLPNSSVSSRADLADPTRVSTPNASPENGSSGTVLPPEQRPTPKPIRPFRFLDLPAEVRLNVYSYYFEPWGWHPADEAFEDTVDLDTRNPARIKSKLVLLRTCRLVYHEAAGYFFGSRYFRVFPTRGGRFFKTKKPLLARTSVRNRSLMTHLEVRFGPGWSRPPPGWVVNDALGLQDCVHVRTVRVLVECDPSDKIFEGFRHRTQDFYQKFSQTLLRETLDRLPSVRTVVLDAWPSVKLSGSMMTYLMAVLLPVARHYEICWGEENSWTDADKALALRSMRAVEGAAVHSEEKSLSIDKSTAIMPETVETNGSDDDFVDDFASRFRFH